MNIKQAKFAANELEGDNYHGFKLFLNAVRMGYAVPSLFLKVLKNFIFQISHLYWNVSWNLKVVMWVCLVLYICWAWFSSHLLLSNVYHQAGYLGAKIVFHCNYFAILWLKSSFTSTEEPMWNLLRNAESLMLRHRCGNHLPYTKIMLNLSFTGHSFG